MPILIKDQLQDLGLAASKSRGQNFLKDEVYIRRIADSILAEAKGTDLLEIGPGLGALTRPLWASGARVLAVELDRGLAENLEATAVPASEGRLTIWHRDILSLEDADLAARGPLFLCGNLPYNISSPVLFWLLNLRRRFSGAVFMLQKEMAQRLMAAPGTKDYGRLAVALKLWFTVRELMDVPPSAFHPRPQVDSSVIALRPLPPEREPGLDPQTLGRFTAVAFAARRKTLLNNLAKKYGRDRSAAALESLSIEPSLRPEVLLPTALADLAKILE